jgi:hypothetical protein
MKMGCSRYDMVAKDLQISFKTGSGKSVVEGSMGRPYLSHSRTLVTLLSSCLVGPISSSSLSEFCPEYVVNKSKGKKIQMTFSPY